MSKKTSCIECGADIGVPGDVVVGEIITCPDCGTDFEVSKVEAKDVSIKPAETVGEDWGE